MMKQGIHYSPKEINSDVKRVLSKIGTGNEPIFIPVRPEFDARKDSCFYNVPRVIAREGGKKHYGWAILDGPFICEGERHAVWETESGELIDVTPREIPITEIMFVSDQDFEYRGKLVDNIRVNKTSDILVDDFIRICESTTRIYNTATRKNELELSMRADMKEKLDILERTKMVYLQHLAAGGNFTGPCFCGKGSLYKSCHRPGILGVLETYDAIVAKVTSS